MNIVGLLGIVAALVALIVMVYKGLHVLIAGTIAALLVAITNGLGAVDGYSVVYLGGVGGFVVSNLAIYLWGGIFMSFITPVALPGRLPMQFQDCLRAKRSTPVCSPAS